MSFRTAHDAVKDFREDIVKVLSCVSDAHVYVPLQESASGGVLVLTVSAGLPFPLKDITGEATNLNMLVSMEYVVKQDEDKQWRVRTTKYTYALRENNQEIVAYHWHPDSADVDFPHLHIGAATGAKHKASTKAHFPTGRVLLEDIIALLERDFAVQMRTEDWQGILEATRDKFNDRKSWPR